MSAGRVPGRAVFFIWFFREGSPIMGKDERPISGDDAGPAADDSGGLGAARSRDAPRLLVVESIQSTRELMGLVLERCYQTQTAATHEQALRRARGTPFDGVVVSVNLRGVEAGVELLEDLRAVEGYDSVPVIVMIGPSLDEARERLGRAGGDAFLQMPFVRAELFDILRRHLNVFEKKERDTGGDVGRGSVD